MDDLAVAYHQSFTRNLIFNIELQPLVAQQMLQEGRDIVRIHLAGVVGHGRR